MLVAGKWDDFGTRVKDNFVNSVGFLAFKAVKPGSWIELGLAALVGWGLSVWLGPIGWLIGFFTPMFNTTLGYIFIEGVGAKLNEHKDWQDLFHNRAAGAGNRHMGVYGSAGNNRK